MKIRFLVLLLIINVHCVSRHRHLTSEEANVIAMTFDDNSVVKEQLKTILQSKIGTAILRMAELNHKLQGPVDELIETIKAFGRQLYERIEQENADYEAILAEHQRKTQEIQSIVNQAEVEMNKEKKKLYSDLLPRKVFKLTAPFYQDELERSLNTLKDSKVENSNQIKMQSAIRKQQMESFSIQQADLTAAINAVDEALRIMESFLPSPNASLIEMEKVDIPPDQRKELTKRLKGIRNRLEPIGKQFSSFISALTNLTEKQSFTQRHYIKSVVDLLNQMRKSITDTITKIIDDENSQQRQYNERIEQLQKELDVFDRKYAESLSEREDISSILSDGDNLVAIHSKDVEVYSERLKQEQANFTMNQKIHDELLRQINEELDVIEKAIKLLKSPSIHEYLQSRMEKILI